MRSLACAISILAPWTGAQDVEGPPRVPPSGHHSLAPEAAIGTVVRQRFIDCQTIPEISPQDRFGTSVAKIGDLDGDGCPELAVGAPGDDGVAADAGAVWILFLDREGGVKRRRRIVPLASEPKLRRTGGPASSLLQAEDAFGMSITSLGDLDADGTPDIAVGASGDRDGGIPEHGAVWILFLRPDGGVKSHQKISATAGGFDSDLRRDEFGSSVASLGDLDRDGVPDLAVGAPGDNDLFGLIDAGAAWLLFLKPDGTVKSQLKIYPERAGGSVPMSADDRFGSSLAWVGDLDGDGLGELAVGATGADQGGKVWILSLSTEGTVEVLREIAYPGTSLALFGSSVTRLGDLDGDGESSSSSESPSIGGGARCGSLS